jgi:arylformamidase
MADILDISVPLKHDISIWPRSAGLKLRNNISLEAGDHANVTKLYLDVHSGTHVDASRHFIKDGSTVDQLPIGCLISRAAVTYLPKSNVITASDLDALTLPPDTK